MQQLLSQLSHVDWAKDGPAILATVVLVLAVFAAVAAAIGALGLLLKALSSGPDSKLYHVGEALVGLGADVSKVVEAVRTVIAKFQGSSMDPGAKVGALLIIAVASFLFMTPKAFAQDGCLGIQPLHCGVTASFVGIRPGLSASPVPLEFGAGGMAEYHWRLWSLGGAVFGNSVFALVKDSHPTSEVTGALFFGLGGLLAGLTSLPWLEQFLGGLRVGPSVVIAGPNGGLLGGFTWKGSVGLVIGGAPELVGVLQSGPGAL